MISFEIKDEIDNLVVKSDDRVFVNKATSRFLEFKKAGKSFLFFSSDEDLKNSKRIFIHVTDAASDLFLKLLNYFTQQVKNSTHSLRGLQIQAKQKIEGIIDETSLKSGMEYPALKEYVIKRVKNNPEETAETLIYLQKRIFEIGAHISSFDIHQGENLQLDIKQHNFRRVYLNVVHAFYDQLKDIEVKAIFHFDDQYGEANKIPCDYGTINVALYNLYSNAVKYALPGSAIYHKFGLSGQNFELSITMNSLRVDQDEVQKIFDPGYRGRHAAAIDGSGIGLHAVKRALALNKMKIEFVPDYSKMSRFDNQQYIENTFVISGSLDQAG